MEIINGFILVGSIATAALALWGIVWGVTKWIHKQNGQSTEISALEKKHDEDTKKLMEQERKDFEELRREEKENIQGVKDELCILTYSVLAILDGLKQQGCNGEVTKAHNALEKYLNQKAHDKK